MSGFFGLDFMIEDGSGALYLVEMNPRCTPLCNLQLGEGRDLIGALSAQLSGKPLQASPPVTENDVIAYFPQSWHWDRKSKLLESSFHDVPWEEPDLVRSCYACLGPTGAFWPACPIVFAAPRSRNGRRPATVFSRLRLRKPKPDEDRGYAN